MTNITKAAQDALAALDEIHAGKRHPQLALAVAQQLRAALKDKAGEVAVAIDNLYNERRDGMTNAIFPPVQIGTRLFAAQPAPVVPDGFALVPVEPTEAMIQAGIDEMPHFTDEPGPVWSAMLSAVPKPGIKGG